MSAQLNLASTTDPRPLVGEIKILLRQLEALELPDLISTINELRREIHRYSPFRDEPVDCVIWVPLDDVAANDYNPNEVAPPEMRLLTRSIEADGYTQPIVAWEKRTEGYEVVDGFHRNLVARKNEAIGTRVHGHLPLAIINHDADKSDRISSTIRHNRARGVHQVEAMSQIVLELKHRNWTDKKIGKELGMEPDEVLRLTQITGLAEMFKSRAFSEAWEATSSDHIDEVIDGDTED